MSAVRHASQVELSEEGAEASATTVITAVRSVSFFSLNGPFFFALVDDVSLAPLFMGVVTNPAPDDAPMPNDEPRGNASHGATETAESKDVDKEQGDDPKTDLGPSAAPDSNGYFPPPTAEKGSEQFLNETPGAPESSGGESAERGNKNSPDLSNAIPT